MEDFSKPSTWDPFEATSSRDAAEASGAWNPFEDLELLELTGELALESDDVDGLEAWLLQAEASQLPRDKVQPKKERLKQLRNGGREEPAEPKPQVPYEVPTRFGSTSLRLEAEGAELEVIKESAREKLLRKRLVPSLDLELSEQEQSVLEKEHRKENIAPSNRQEKVLEYPIRLVFPNGSMEEVQVNPCDKASSLLVQLLPMKRSHPFPEDFALFLPSGTALDFHRPLQAQGVHGGMELRVDEAYFAEGPAMMPTESPSDEEVDFDHLNFTREVENGWNLIYWPLCVALATFQEVQVAEQKHQEVVVLGWNACHDVEVMQLCQEVSFNIGSDFLIVTGNEAAPDTWWLTEEEEAVLAAAGRSNLRGAGAPARPKASMLRIDHQAAPSDLAPAILAGLRAAGCSTSMMLLVVCRAFQSRRPVSLLKWCLQQQDYAHWRVSVLPYSWDPRFVYLEDCKHRGDDVILEAQLLTEMNPMVWIEEEGQEAEIALSRLLLAHPVEPARAHWHNGFYSKPFKERTRLAREGAAGTHCEWFRWQKPAPLSAESHAKVAKHATTRRTKPSVDDEEPPPLVSHE